MGIKTEIKKNLKIIFRNISSLSMLVLGPLALILLIGFAFSGSELHDIRLGVYSSSYDNLGPVLNNLSYFGEIVKYGSIGECVSSLAKEDVHVCLQFSKDFIAQENGKIPTGQITLYYDNTRDKISNVVADVISDYLGLAAKEISFKSAKSIFENIQELVVYLGDKKEDIADLRNQSFEIREKLVERKAKLKQMYSLFKPRYDRIKSFHAVVNIEYDATEEAYEQLNNKKTELISAFEQYYGDLDFISALFGSYDYYLFDVNGTYQLNTNASNASAYYNLSDFEYINLSNYTLILGEPNQFNEAILVNISSLSDYELIGLKLELMRDKADDYNSAIINYENSSSNLFIYIGKTKNEIDKMVADLDYVNAILIEEMYLTDELIISIDKSVVEIDKIVSELDSGLAKLDNIGPDLAETLVNPIIKMFEPLVKKIENIELVFPLLLSVVIVFTSLLFSNIVTLKEINSKAFFRNLIAPVNDVVYTFGLLLTSFIVVLFQIMILLLVAQYRFKIDVLSRLPSLLLVCIILVFIFLSIGMLIAYIFKKEQTSVLTTTFVALAFFLFSDAIAPLEAMPKLASILAGFNPLVISTNIFKKIIIHDFTLALVADKITLLLFYLLIILIILVLISKKKNKL